MKKLYFLASAAISFTTAACHNKDRDPQPEACTLVPESGPCFAAFTRYYFNPKEKKCKPFT